MSPLAYFLFIISISLAQATDSNPTQRVDAKSKSDLLAYMPEETGFVVVIDFRRAGLTRDVFDAAANLYAPNPKLADSISNMLADISGEIALGSIPAPPKRDETEDVILVMDISKNGFNFEDWLENKFLHVLRQMGRRGENANLRIEGENGRFKIVDPRENKPIFYIASRQGIAVGASRGDLVQKALLNSNADKNLARLASVRNMFRTIPQDAIARFVFNPKPYIDNRDKPKPRSTDELLEQILAPEDLRAAGGYLRWDASSLEFCAAATFAEECKGIANWLKGTNSESALLPGLSTEFPVVASVAVNSLSSAPSAFYSVTDQFDETIGVEYREDLASFEKETGVDFNASILGQLADEVAIAIRPDFSSQPPIGWAAVGRISNPEVFRSAADKLTKHFGLSYSTENLSGLKIHSAEGIDNLNWTISDNRLILGNSPTAVRDAARALQNASRPSETLTHATQSLGRSQRLRLHADLSMIAAQAPMIPMLAGPKFGPLIRDGYVAATLTNNNNAAHLKLRWQLGRSAIESTKTGDGGGAAEQLVASLGTQMFESMTAARRQAQRVIGMSDMRNVTQALHFYANQHQGQFPESLERLLVEVPQIVSIDAFKNPFTGEGPNDPSELETEGHVIYRPGLTNKAAPNEVILCERMVTRFGEEAVASFAFVDGHVESLPEPLASRIIDMIKAGEESVTIEVAKARLSEK